MSFDFVDLNNKYKDFINRGLSAAYEYDYIIVTSKVFILL